MVRIVGPHGAAVVVLPQDLTTGVLAQFATLLHRLAA
jgi:hypothetical protein